MSQGVVYLMEGVQLNGQRCAKVGKTRHFTARMSALSSHGYAGASKLKKKYAIRVDDADEVEAVLLAVLAPYRVACEEYNRNPHAIELFDVDPDVVENLMACLEGEQIYPLQDALGIAPLPEEPIQLGFPFRHADSSSPNLDRVVSLICSLRGTLETKTVVKLLSGQGVFVEGYGDLIGCLKPMVSEMELGLIACFLLDETRDYRFRDPAGYGEVFGSRDPRNRRARILAESILKANGVLIGNSTLRRHSYDYRSQYDAIFVSGESTQSVWANRF